MEVSSPASNSTKPDRPPADHGGSVFVVCGVYPAAAPLSSSIRVVMSRME